VDKQHKAMVASLLAQKANAVRWMRHQETRLVSQVQETHVSRAPIAALLQSECSLLEDFRTLLLAPQQQAQTRQHVAQSGVR
jgi:D-arabinose 5-phosphate isomerase GutQ